MGIPGQAETPQAFLNWLIHDPEQANIPQNAICPDYRKFNKPKDGKNNFTIAFSNSGAKSKIDAYTTGRTDLRYWGPTANEMWNNIRISGRWTETHMQRDKRELLNIAWQCIKEKFGIDAVADNAAGLLLDHRCSRIRYVQADQEANASHHCVRDCRRPQGENLLLNSEPLQHQADRGHGRRTIQEGGRNPKESYQRRQDLQEFEPQKPRLRPKVPRQPCEEIPPQILEAHIPEHF